jgi:hypothetical protein
MSQTQRSPSKRAAYWQDLVDQWSRSGQTQAAFCRKRGINYGSFVWWKRQLTSAASGAGVPRGSRGRRGRTTKTGPFVEVQLSPARASYEVVLARGRLLRIYGTFDSESVSRLITAVEAAC